MATRTILSPTWFSLQRYVRANQLDFAGWKTQIGNRIHLRGLLSAGKLDDFDSQFEEVAQAPFYDLDFAAAYASSASVSPLTVKNAREIILATDGFAYPDKTARITQCDPMLEAIGQEGFAMTRHLVIDLHASKIKIRRDFAKYLDAELKKNRDKYARSREAEITQAVLASWCDRLILPYEDLALWFLRYEKKVPSDNRLANWLDVDGSTGADKVRQIRKTAREAFTLTTLRQLDLAAIELSEENQSGEKS